MPWKEPGKGEKDPWSSGDQQPPDLEEVFRNVNKRLRSIFGGGGGSGADRKSESSGSGGMFSILLIALVLWVGWDSVHIVDEAEEGVVLRLGAYNRTLSPGINLTLPRPLETMTIWIALDDVTPENGPMSFIPGSHKGKKQYTHHREERDNYTIFDVCDSEHFDESTAVDLVIHAGQVSYHDVYMIHGSKPNLTEHRRAAFIVRLMPASSFYDHELGRVAGKKNSSHDYGSRPLFLVRGKDVCGKNDFSTGH